MRHISLVVDQFKGAVSSNVQLYAFSKSQVFNFDLKLLSVSAILMLTGMLFHKVGAATLKDSDPQVFNLYLGILSRSLELERKALGGIYGETSLLR